MEILGKSIMLVEFFLSMIYVHSQIMFTESKPQVCKNFKLCEDVTVWDAVFHSAQLLMGSMQKAIYFKVAFSK